jgi:hypothetical protein
MIQLLAAPVLEPLLELPVGELVVVVVAAAVSGFLLSLLSLLLSLAAELSVEASELFLDPPLL